MRLTDIYAQETAVRVLVTSIQRAAVAHAYLFTGPRGCGKTSAAIAYASALNCADPTPEGDACGRCLSCLRIESGMDSDVTLISPDGNQTKIDQMHGMIKELNFAPLSGIYKTIIIEQADTLNPSSENSILKTLEEPPAYAVLILLSSNPNSLLPTIRSRCRKIRFRKASYQETINYLVESTNLTDEDAKIIGACSQGFIGRAAQLASNSDFMQERRMVLMELNQWIDGPDVLGLSFAEMMRSGSEPKKNDPDTRTRVRRLTDMLDYIMLWYADILGLKVRGADALITNRDYIDQLQYQASIYSTDRLASGLRSIMDTRRYLEGNITPQLVLENMFFDLRPDMI